MQIFVRPDFYVPLAMARRFSTSATQDFFEDRNDRGLIVRGRLKRGVTLQQARNELAALARDLESEHPESNRNRGAMVRTQFQMRTRADETNWKFGVIFAVLSLAVLLVACTNAAGLLLARASTRTREVAVRLALGAGRSRLIRMLLTESLLLACLGGLAGVGVGFVALRILHRFSIPTTLPVQIPFRMDARLLLASLVLSLASAIAFGLAPALQSTRGNLVEGLKAADVEPLGRKRLWGRNVLVVAQVSASLMLLTASFLMVRGFHNGLVEGMEFAKVAKDHVLMASFDPRLLQYDAARTQRFYQQLAERAREAPGVQSAGLTQNTPLGIVGVARTVRYRDTGEKSLDFVYLPLAQRPVSRMTLLLRATAGPLTVLEPLQDIVRTLDPNLPIVDTRTYMTIYRYAAVDGPGVAINLVTIMGATALLLAIAGLYGLVAYNVSRRTREIGIRMAIGASPPDVIRLVLGKGLVLVAVGTVIGLVLGFTLEQLMNSMLFNAGGVDVWVYLVVVRAMFLVTMLAAYVPALRASRIEPTEALRYE